MSLMDSAAPARTGRPGSGPERLYLHPGFLDLERCARLCEEMATAVAPEPADVLPSDRVHDGGRRAWYIDVSESTLCRVESRLDAVRASVAAFFGCLLGEREGAGFLRYDPGGFYGPHRDRGDDAEWPGAARRRVSAVLFLNSASSDHGQTAGPGHFVGGTLRLFLDADEPVEVLPVAGTLVAFPSDALHEVTPVVAGVRYAVVDWYYDAAVASATHGS